MARAAAGRRKSAKPDAQPRRSGRERALGGEDEMFFMKLRRGAKPVFILLAVVFAGSFIFLGVGTGNAGFGDVLAGLNLGGSGADVDGARKRVRENPKDATAYRELATALQTDGKPDEAIAPLERYTSMRRRDTDALRELAAL